MLPEGGGAGAVDDVRRELSDRDGAMRELLGIHSRSYPTLSFLLFQSSYSLVFTINRKTY
jgi:hypothetical protein